jgi:hypothetical protein
MVKRSLLNKVKTSEFSKGIFDNVIITGVDVQDRKGANGPINKMVYIKFAQIDETGKKLKESELSWWKPDITSEYFKTNLQEICLQLHNVLEAYIGEEEAFNAFSTVFDFLELDSHEEIETRRWKQSELSALINELKESFETAITPYINKMDQLIRLKITTNYKGEDIEIPKYGKFVESMSVEKSTLEFTANEIKTHSKAGTVTTAAATAPSSTNANSTI